MSRTLYIKNKIFSLKGKMFINDKHDRVVYVANRESVFSASRWKINKNQLAVASLKRKVFSWSPTWTVSSAVGDFVIKRQLWSWTRCYTVINGPFDGAMAKGKIWSLKFEIEADGQKIAQVKREAFSIKDVHVFEIINDDEKAELLTVIFMVALRSDRYSENGVLSSPSS